jgi:hypothetical protein
MASARALAYQRLKANLQDPNYQPSPQELQAAGYSQRPDLVNGRMISPNASLNGRPVQSQQPGMAADPPQPQPPSQQPQAEPPPPQPQIASTVPGTRGRSPQSTLEAQAKMLAERQTREETMAPMRQQLYDAESQYQDTRYRDQRQERAMQQQQSQAAAARRAEIARTGDPNVLLRQEHRQQTLQQNGLQDNFTGPTPGAAQVTPDAIAADPRLSLGQSAGRFMPQSMARDEYQGNVSRNNFYDNQRTNDMAAAGSQPTPMFRNPSLASRNAVGMQSGMGQQQPGAAPPTQGFGMQPPQVGVKSPQLGRPMTPSKPMTPFGRHMSGLKGPIGNTLGRSSGGGSSPGYGSGAGLGHSLTGLGGGMPKMSGYGSLAEQLGAMVAMALKTASSPFYKTVEPETTTKPAPRPSQPLPAAKQPATGRKQQLIDMRRRYF